MLFQLQSVFSSHYEFIWLISFLRLVKICAEEFPLFLGNQRHNNLLSWIKNNKSGTEYVRLFLWNI